jgi:uncharacterized membrane protein YhaH (DUF805 family)
MSLTELLFSFKGRINRKQWWLTSLAVAAVSSVTSTILNFPPDLIMAVIAAAVATVLSKKGPYATDYIVASFFIAAVFGLIALAISIWLFVEIGFLRGTQGLNRFGPDPLGTLRTDAQL